MKSATTSSLFPMNLNGILGLNLLNNTKLPQQSLLELPFSSRSNQQYPEKITHHRSWGEDLYATKKLKTNQGKENIIVIDSEDEGDFETEVKKVPSENNNVMMNSNFEGINNVDQSFMQSSFYENMLNKSAEMILYLNELQALSNLQRLQTATYKSPSVDFNSLFLSALFDNQKSNIPNDLALIQQPQSVSDKKSEVILIEDAEEKNSLEIKKSEVVSNTCSLPNISDKNFDAFSSESFQKEKRIKSKKSSEKTSKTNASTSAKERAMERWRAVKESQAEAEKPYVIDLHVDSNNPDNHIKAVPIGPAYQTTVPPLVLNRRSKKEGRKVKAVWIPDEQNSDRYRKYIEMMEQTLRRTISNEEKAVKLLLEHGMDIERLLKHLQRNQMHFRNYFKTDQRALRNSN